MFFDALTSSRLHYINTFLDLQPQKNRKFQQQKLHKEFLMNLTSQFFFAEIFYWTRNFLLHFKWMICEDARTRYSRLVYLINHHYYFLGFDFLICYLSTLTLNEITTFSKLIESNFWLSWEECWKKGEKCSAFRCAILKRIFLFYVNFK